MVLENIVIILIIMIITGITVGLISSFFGVGASFIMVPILMFCFEIYMGASPQISPYVAFGTNMAIVVPTTLSGFYKHIREMKKKNQKFPYKHYLNFAIPVGIGSFIGAILSYILFSNFRLYAGLILKLLYGVYCVLGAYRYLTAKPKLINVLPELARGKSYTYGSLSGMLAHFIGIGGGIIYLSILNTILEIPIQTAVTLSLGTMVIGSSIGFTSFLFLGYNDSIINASEYPIYSIGWFNLLAFVGIGLFSILFAQIGSRLTRKVQPKKFKILLAILYIYMGIRLIFDSIYHFYEF
ncbi:MAG: sulfite exporter TauE/SafE family protein [Candidatus Helarchaeota archaeon]